MHRVVPELIVENYRAGHFSGEFPAVGLFLDLTGFSTMTDTLMQQGQHGAEVLANLMHGVFDPLVENIFNYGGKIVSFAGDGIMALFPIDSDQKETSVRALASAWMIQRRLLERPAQQTPYGKFRFSIKIGVTIGDVSWRILHSVDGRDATYYFRGSAVDDSARAEHKAQAGEIILTENIYELLRDEIKVAPLGALHRFDGFIRPLPDPTPSTFPPVDLEISKHFMPENVLTLHTRGEFRQIVNLFMRFPDLPDEKLGEFIHSVFELRKRYGGLLNRLDFGDKGCNMLMLWGAPVTYENDIGRALNFLADLKEQIDFPITAGVTYYVAHAGYLGSALCEDYTCFGWGVNLASRFMMSAPEGSIWTDARIARRVKNRFELEYRGDLQFKGFAAEQKVFSFSGRRSQESFFQGEFVGRELELPRLIDLLQPLWRGQFAGVTVIWGDAGIGKSRLAFELRNSIVEVGKPLLWALCHSDQILRQSFNPFRYWVFRYFDIDSSMDDSAQKQAFDSKLNLLIERTPDPDLASELDRVRTVLGALLDLYWPASFYETLDAEGRYNNTLNALIALIKAESLRQPVLLFVEDAQFMDEDSKTFLARLKAALTAGSAEYPVAMLVSSRQVGVESFLNEDLIDQSMVLGGLSTQALFDLAEIYLGGVAAPDLVRLLEARSEGNPYFAEQILIYLQEESFLEMSAQGWRVTRRLQDSSLPADIRSLLVARLDQLTYHTKDVIQTASILGREFEAPVLTEMISGNRILDNELAEAERANIWTAISRSRYIFTHGLLRDAAYAMQIRARRVELHAVALNALEKIYAGEVGHHYGEMAHHAERARLSEKALYYLRHAGKASADLYQNSQAVDYYTRALAFVDPDDLATQYDLLAERVELYSRMGKRELQWKDLTALERWAEDLGDEDRTAKTIMLQASYYFATSDYLNSIDYAKRAEMFSTSVANTDISLYTQVVWCMALLRLGRLDEAMQRAQTTLDKDRAAGNRKEEGRVLTVMGLIALEQKVPALAQKYLLDALDIAHEIKDPSLETRALNNLARLEDSVNRNYALALSYYEQTYKIAREIGDRTAECTLLGNLGFTSGMQGDFLAARSFHEQALVVAREIGSLYQELYILINLSAVTGIQNEADLALKYARQAGEISQKTSEKVGEAWAMLYLGHAYLLKKEFLLAQTAYRKSIEIRSELNQPTLALEPMAGLVESYVLANDLDSALREAESILVLLPHSSTLDGVDEPLRVYHACYLILSKLQDPRSKLILQTANGLLEAQVSMFSDDNARKRYVENIPWRNAIRLAASDIEDLGGQAS